MFENPLAQCLVSATYADMSAGAIVRDLIQRAQERGKAVTCGTVYEGPMIQSMVCNSQPINEALASIAELTHSIVRYRIDYRMDGPVTAFIVSFTAE